MMPAATPISRVIPIKTALGIVTVTNKNFVLTGWVF
jgi:hypothetical protein